MNGVSYRDIWSITRVNLIANRNHIRKYRQDGSMKVIMSDQDIMLDKVLNCDANSIQFDLELEVYQGGTQLILHSDTNKCQNCKA